MTDLYTEAELYRAVHHVLAGHPYRVHHAQDPHPSDTRSQRLTIWRDAEPIAHDLHEAGRAFYNGIHDAGGHVSAWPRRGRPDLPPWLWQVRIIYGDFTRPDCYDRGEAASKDEAKAAADAAVAAWVRRSMLAGQLFVEREQPALFAPPPVYGGMARAKILRQTTGATIGDCRKALIECRDDMDRAIEWLRARMLMAGGGS